MMTHAGKPPCEVNDPHFGHVTAATRPPVRTARGAGGTAAAASPPTPSVEPHQHGRPRWPSAGRIATAATGCPTSKARPRSRPVGRPGGLGVATGQRQQARGDPTGTAIPSIRGTGAASLPARSREGVWNSDQPSHQHRRARRHRCATSRHGRCARESQARTHIGRPLPRVRLMIRRRSPAQPAPDASAMTVHASRAPRRNGSSFSRTAGERRWRCPRIHGERP
jgi:hypothetical protein